MSPQITVVQQWTAADCDAHHLTDKVEAEMSGAYEPIELTRRLPPTFRASLDTWNMGPMALTECRCDPCHGRRSRRAIEAGPKRIGIQVIQSGSERILFGSQSAVLSEGDLVIWRSDVPYEFEVLETLSKVTLSVPWSLLENRLPRVSRYQGGVVSTKDVVGEIASAYINSIRACVEGGDQRSAGLSAIGMEILSTLVARQQDDPRVSVRTGTLERILQYVEQNMHDPDLSVPMIANAHRVSVRYVHRLLQESGLSAKSYLSKRRLEKCREAFADERFQNVQIMEIARLYGYLDAATFSRSFKREYGISPKQLRDQASLGGEEAAWVSTPLAELDRMNSPEATEGVRAFIDKRAPSWRT